MAKAKSIARTPATITQIGEAIQSILDDTEASDGSNVKSFRHGHLLDLQHSLEERIFWTIAQTPQDAMVQIARLSAEIESFDYEGADQRSREVNYLALLRKAERVLYSITDWIEREHQVDRPAVTEFYMGKRFNPWGYQRAYMPKTKSR